MKILSLSLLILALPCLSSAAVTTSGNFKTGATTPTLTISSSISIVVTGAAPVKVQALVFDEWVVGDGNLTGVSSTSLVSYSIDDGPTQTVPIQFLIDNHSSVQNSLTRNDGYIYFTTAFTVNPGQIVTFSVQTLTFNSAGGFNQPPAVFSGNVYLVNSTSVAVSSLTPIPEPSIALLGAVGSLGLLRRRR